MTQRLQITNCKTSRIGEIVVMKEITDINTINSPPTNQINRPSETQAPASSVASSNDVFAQVSEDEKKTRKSIFDEIFDEQQKKTNVLDQLLCDDTPHLLFVCDKGVFSRTKNFALTKSGGFFYCMNGKPLDAIPPWLFHSVSKNDDKEELLVIKDDLSSVAYVTREKSFSRNKGYTWSEDKFYCEIERVE